MNTAHDIQTRLERSAAQRLGYLPDALPAEYKSLLAAVAWQMAHLYGLLDGSNDRIVYRLLRRLMGAATPAVKPAAAITCARPVAAEVVLPVRHAFRADNGLYFSAAFPSRLVNGYVALQVSAGAVVTCSPLHREVRSEVATGLDLPRQVLWLGLSLHEQATDLSGAGFYFHWPDLGAEKQQLLPFVEWELAGRKLPTVAGFVPAQRQKLPDFPDEAFFQRRKLEDAALELCRQQVLTIDPAGAAATAMPRSALPDAFAEPRPADPLFGEELLWLKLTFPDAFSEQDLRDLRVWMNAFPVLNRRLETRKDIQVRDDAFQVVKLTDTGGEESRDSGREFFLDLQNVWSNELAAYRPAAFAPGGHLHLPPGAYALQYGNAEAWDRGDAHEKVRFLMQSLEDHMLGLGSAEREALGRNLSALESALNQVRQGLNNFRSHPSYYLHLRAVQPREQLFIEFWLTQGWHANGRLTAGTTLTCEGAPIQDPGMVLLTEPEGGRDPLDEAGQIAAFRADLLRRALASEENTNRLCAR